jgi:hypothetical protein
MRMKMNGPQCTKFSYMSSWMNVNYFTSFSTTRPTLHKVHAMSNLSFLSSIQNLSCFFVFAFQATSKTLCFLCVHLEQNPKPCVFFSSSQDVAFLGCFFRTIEHPRHCISYVFKMEPSALT